MLCAKKLAVKRKTGTAPKYQRFVNNQE